MSRYLVIFSFICVIGFVTSQLNLPNNDLERFGINVLILLFKLLSAILKVPKILGLPPVPVVSDIPCLIDRVFVIMKETNVSNFSSS